MSARHRQMRKLVRIVERGVYGDVRYFYERGWDWHRTVEGQEFWWDVANRLDRIRMRMKPPLELHPLQIPPPQKID